MKTDFPIFTHQPELVYLDNAATVQKPRAVIEGVSRYLETSYANIHRGQYDLAQRSELLYDEARRVVADFINAKEEEIIFTANSTDSCNRLVHALEHSRRIQSGDIILLSTAEHHANIVPRQMLAQRTGCEVRFFQVTPEGQIDLAAFQELYTHRVKLVGCALVSNVLGTLVDIDVLTPLLRDETLLVIDASQSVVHTRLDVETSRADFCYFTGHKIGAFTGIGVLRGKERHLSLLQPGTGGGGAVEMVTTTGFTLHAAPDKFEPGTPNLVGAVSLLYAIQYFQERWGYDRLREHEAPLVRSVLQELTKREQAGALRLLGSHDPAQKIGLFSFILQQGKTPTGLGDRMGKHNICIRCGGQCAYPLHHIVQADAGTCRISLRLTNDSEDLNRFFSQLQAYLQAPGR